MSTQPAGSHTATATILFTDLVGSTAQRAQLGEEAAETLRRTHDRLLADAVAAHRGTVAKHVGDGIMATFAARPMLSPRRSRSSRPLTGTTAVRAARRWRCASGSVWATSPGSRAIVSAPP